MNLFDIDLYDSSNPDGQRVYPGQARTSDPYQQTDQCPSGHSWEAGMCVVHPEDLWSWKPTDRKVECGCCETVFTPKGDK